MACNSGGSSDVKQTVYNALVGDASLAAISGTDIYYNVLPDRFNVQNPAVTLVVRTGETIRDLEGDILYKSKNVNIRMYSNDQEIIYNLLDNIERISDTLAYENKEVDDDPFWDETLQWFILDMDFEMNEF